MKFLKRIKPGNWALISLAGLVVVVSGLMIGQYVSNMPVQREVALALYNNKSDNRKVGERVEMAVRLDLKDTSAKKYPIQLEGRAEGKWQVIKKFDATKTSSTVVFRVKPAKAGDITYRAEVLTPSGVLTTNELVLHVTK